MSGFPLVEVSVSGFKSIQNCVLELGELNVVIGANGAGKSNFMSFFGMVSSFACERLQEYVGMNGGPDAILHFGQKQTEELSARLVFEKGSAYGFTLKPTLDGRMMFTREHWSHATDKVDADFGTGHFESRVFREECIARYLRNLRIYHFHDTGDKSLVKQSRPINDNDFLGHDARNLAAFLYRLEKTHNAEFQMIVNTVALAAPFFAGFHLRPNPLNENTIELEWLEKGGQTPFKAHLLSDGTLRFICLATLLLQPLELKPATILIDEPELGLHPFAVNLLAGMLKSASVDTQIIVSTQSPELLTRFQAKDVIVADRTGNGSHLHRLNEADLAVWLEEYSLGELWNMNVLGGRPLL